MLTLSLSVLGDFLLCSKSSMSCLQGVQKLSEKCHSAVVRSYSRQPSDLLRIILPADLTGDMLFIEKSHELCYWLCFLLHY